MRSTGSSCWRLVASEPLSSFRRLQGESFRSSHSTHRIHVCSLPTDPSYSGTHAARGRRRIRRCEWHSLRRGDRARWPELERSRNGRERRLSARHCFRCAVWPGARLQRAQAHPHRPSDCRGDPLAPRRRSARRPDRRPVGGAVRAGGTVDRAILGDAASLGVAPLRRAVPRTSVSSMARCFGYSREMLHRSR